MYMKMGNYQITVKLFLGYDRNSFYLHCIGNKMLWGTNRCTDLSERNGEPNKRLLYKLLLQLLVHVCKLSPDNMKN